MIVLSQIKPDNYLIKISWDILSNALLKSKAIKSIAFD